MLRFTTKLFFDKMLLIFTSTSFSSILQNDFQVSSEAKNVLILLSLLLLENSVLNYFRRLNRRWCTDELNPEPKKKKNKFTPEACHCLTGPASSSSYSCFVNSQTHLIIVRICYVL